MDTIKMREVRSADLERCFEIESISYEGDEAASREKIQKRISTYPEGFVVLEVGKNIAGFINSGATDAVVLSDESFKELEGHDPKGKYIVIMSVVVDPLHQRKGYAGMLINYLIEKMSCLGKTEIYLICQTQLIKMYGKYGFQYLAESDSDHGGLSWHEMSLSLKNQV